MKYELTENTKVINGITLYQIQALKDFGDVKTGDLGGWIEKESNLSQEGNCWVSDNAQVYENAQVFGKDRVYENAWVFGNTRVYGDVKLHMDVKSKSTTTKIIFEKQYDGESICDVERDMLEVFNPEINDIPTDEHGFQVGTFTVTITWKNA